MPFCSVEGIRVPLQNLTQLSQFPRKLRLVPVVQLLIRRVVAKGERLGLEERLVSDMRSAGTLWVSGPFATFFTRFFAIPLSTPLPLTYVAPNRWYARVAANDGGRAVALGIHRSALEVGLRAHGSEGGW